MSASVLALIQFSISVISILSLFFQDGKARKASDVYFFAELLHGGIDEALDGHVRIFYKRLVKEDHFAEIAGKLALEDLFLHCGWLAL